MNTITNKTQKRNLLSFISIIFLALTTLTMSACNESSVNASGGLSGYPESVQYGIVSVEYYESLQEFYEHSDGHRNRLNSIFQLLIERMEIIEEENFSMTYDGVLKGYGYFLDRSLEASPETDVDKEIDEIYREMVDYYRDGINALKLFPISYTKDYLILATEKITEAEKLLVEFDSITGELDIQKRIKNK